MTQVRATQFFFALVACVITALAAEAAEAPRITRAIPAAAAPGEPVEITFSGERLESVTSLWTSFPAESEKIKSSSKEAVFRLIVASNAPVQIGVVRLIGGNTLSDLFLLAVDDLPSIRKSGAKKEIPQTLKAGTAIDGTVDELGTDYFSFSAKKGEQFSVELLARRLGSSLDPLLRIFDQSGKELVYSLQFNEPNGDPRFRFTAPEAGTYTIELRDVSYHGGAGYFYRLRVGKFPLITSPFPAVVERGSSAKVHFVGPAIAGLAPQPIQRSNSVSDELFLPLSRQLKRVTGSGFAVLRISDLPQIIETEPNENSAEATKISLPVGINGRFEKARDRDYYEFNAKKGDRVVFAAKTRSLGSVCDVSLRLLDSANAQVAESTNTTANEGFLAANVDKPGKYLLLVEELTGTGGTDLIYHIDGKVQPAGFALAIENDKSEKSTNGWVAIHVSCMRDGYNGTVSLSLKGLDGCRLENAVIKKTNTTLRVFLPESLPPTQVAVVRIYGEATIHDKPYIVMASTMPAIRKTFPMLIYPP